VSLGYLIKLPLDLALRYFRKMLDAFSSPPFYTKYVRLPSANDPVPPRIRNNPKFWPFFKGALGALDGSHISSSPPAIERASNRNRKGFVSQNCLFACSFDLEFLFAYTGWEGSATDARVYEAAREGDLTIPEGKYYLADAGYPSCSELLVPYRGIRYHLAEWGRASLRYALYYFPTRYLLHRHYRPVNKEELFNLRHASARNVIERIFGVLKRRFRILLLGPEYSLDIQARIPTALCAIHNFIREHDLDEETSLGDVDDSDHNDDDGNNNLTGAANAAPEEDEVSARRDAIALEMWQDYQRVCRERGIDGEDPLDYDEDGDELTELGSDDPP
jgi:DDE superfamily endonuclease